MIRKLDEYKQKWDVQSSNTIQLSLHRMEKALDLLGNPHKQLKFVHVTGTNGKGSTIAFLEKFLLKHHLNVGKFTSPCIVDIHDQIQINGHFITSTELDEIFQQIKQCGLSGLLTDFELLTCIAFLHFYKRKVNIVLLEVGMGGREDSTNVIEPVISIITSIALEHTNFLGNTIQSIAYHKAGIIKKEIPVVVGEVPETARKVVINEAKEKNAPVYVLGNDFTITTKDKGEEYVFSEENIRISNIKRKLQGNHQGQNMAIALTAFLIVAKNMALTVSIDKLLEGAKEAYIPSRFEQVLPNVYFDGAHNPASALTLVQTIEKLFPKETIRFVIGMVNDKDCKQVLQYFEQISDEFYFVNFNNHRAMKAENLYNLSKATKKEIIFDTIPFLKNCSKRKGVTIATGSLYLLAEIRNQLNREQN